MDSGISECTYKLTVRNTLFEKGRYTMKIRRNIFLFVMVLVLTFVLAACGNSSIPAKSSFSVTGDSGNTISADTSETEEAAHGGISDMAENSSYESVEGLKIKMITDSTEVVITLNDSRAASDLAAMLPLELTLIERNSFAKGMTLPEPLSSTEQTTREYEIGDFGYWNAGPDLAIFYDDIYEQTIVDVIPLGYAESGAETLAGETGTVRLEFVEDERNQK